MIDKTLITIAVIKIFEIRFQIYLPGQISEEKDTIRKTLSAEIKAWTRKVLTGI